MGVSVRILVTGGAGFIGSHVVERLLEEGREVTVLDDLSTGSLDKLPRAAPGLRFVRGDVADERAVRDALDGCEALIHLAAVASVQASMERPLETHRTNLEGSLRVFEGAAAAGVRRAVLASSAAVYGDVDALPLAEDGPTRPLSPYAADKLAAEHYLAHYHRSGRLPGVALRFFNVYGPRQDASNPYSGVISIFLERARRGAPVTVYGDGRQSRDFVYVRDVAALVTAALRHPVEAEAPVYNVGRGASVSLLELIDTLGRLTAPLRVTHADPRPGDIRHSRADTARLLALAARLETAPPSTPLREGLRAMLEPEPSAS